MTQPTVLTEVTLPSHQAVKSGKVRELFDLDDHYLVVATDRVSAFDSILPTGIPWKGHVLNQLSEWWFGRTTDIVGNHLVTSDVSAYPDALQPSRDILQGRSMLVRKAEALPVECVARGYLIGSGWKEYGESRSVSGVPLREGYQLADRLDEPIFTPAAKAETGHDENISYERMVETVGADVAEQLRDHTLALYNFAASFALEHGIIIADTKFEFGLIDGNVTLIDEALTPDSSRFWPAASYAPGSSPPSFDKQFVRDYLEDIAWDKEPPAPPLPDDIVAKTSDKYRQAFRTLTGRDPQL